MKTAARAPCRTRAPFRLKNLSCQTSYQQIVEAIVSFTAYNLIAEIILKTAWSVLNETIGSWQHDGRFNEGKLNYFAATKVVFSKNSWVNIFQGSRIFHGS